MKLAALQQHLADTGRYTGKVDGLYGPMTRAAIMKALEDGPDTPVGAADFNTTGIQLGVVPAAIRAFWKVEAAGAGFQSGYPKVLPEPHRFSRNTAHTFDMTNPTLSYPKWGQRPYPADQAARYDMICQWVYILSKRDMDIDAAFMSASFGAPQILGENFALCGYANAFAFAEGMARDEPQQLRAFVSFVTNAGILPYLRKVNATVESWTPVAVRYNGTAQRQNRYDEKMAAAYVSFGGK